MYHEDHCPVQLTSFCSFGSPKDSNMVQWRPRDERCPPLGVSWELTEINSCAAALQWFGHVQWSNTFQYYNWLVKTCFNFLPSHSTNLEITRGVIRSLFQLNTR